MPKLLRVLELYSGIGGMHWALKENGLPFQVVAAADINNVANDIYKFNLKGVKILQRVIESLTIEDLNKLSPDLITMSPPCQPFTRVGLQKDGTDARTKSFFHVLELLPKLSKLPSYIFVENVKGFETSDTHHHLMDTLSQAGYQVQEFLVTPNQFGVPNSRLRYYLLAKLNNLKFNFPVKEGVRDDLPECIHPFLTHRVSNTSYTETPQSVQCATNPNVCNTQSSSTNNSNGDSHCTIPHQESVQGAHSAEQSEHSDCRGEEPRAARERYQDISRPVSEYLENQTEEYFASFAVPDKFLKRFWSMDIVTKSSRNCCCFTKAYAHHIDGAGSTLQCSEESQMDLNMVKETRSPDEATLEAIQALKLRFFTPREVANLMCFPPEFKFPENLTTVQCYRVLGNSLNVHVVSILLRLLCWGEDLDR